jgi:hypothetical protein
MRFDAKKYPFQFVDNQWIVNISHSSMRKTASQHAENRIQECDKPQKSCGLSLLDNRCVHWFSRTAPAALRSPFAKCGSR